MGIIIMLIGSASHYVFIFIGGGLIVHSIYKIVNTPKSSRMVLKNGYDGTAYFVRSSELLGKSRYRYSVCYGYTDENDEYHEVEAPGLFTYDQATSIQGCGSFPIKYIGKESVPLVDLSTLSPATW